MRRKPLIVMKFGGTSVGSAERFRQCASIVSESARRNRVVVVVSAVATVTDLIFKSIETARQGDLTATEENLGRFETLHRLLIHELFAGLQEAEVLEQVEQVLAQFRLACTALLTLRSEVSSQARDSLAAMGERISAAILAGYLSQTGTASEFVRAENAIVTDSNFGNAAPDISATSARCARSILPVVDRGVVPVVAGYSGATPDGITTTLGRGGSDYSATILGAAIVADEVWIWTDVDGVLSADPRICPDATILPEISFAEAIELAYYGAKVIHPKAAVPVLESGIPIRIKNSFRPQVAGTRITRTSSSSNSPVKAVTCVKNAMLITLVTGKDVHPSELFGRLFLRLGQERIDTLFATQSSPEHALGLVLRQEDGARVRQLINSIFRMELAQGVLNPVSVRDDIAVIAILGEAMKGTWGILGRAFSAVARREVSVIAVAQGASELSICFAVPSADCSEVVRVVHNEFCDNGSFLRAADAESSQAIASGAL